MKWRAECYMTGKSVDIETKTPPVIEFEEWPVWTPGTAGAKMSGVHKWLPLELVTSGHTLVNLTKLGAGQVRPHWATPNCFGLRGPYDDKNHYVIETAFLSEDLKTLYIRDAVIKPSV